MKSILCIIFILLVVGNLFAQRETISLNGLWNIDESVDSLDHS